MIYEKQNKKMRPTAVVLLLIKLLDTKRVPLPSHPFQKVTKVLKKRLGYY